MKTTHPVHLLLPLILLSTATFSLGAQTPYMDAMYIDVRWDRTDTLGEATMRLEYRMRFPSETGPDSSHVDRRIVEIGPGLQKEYSLILETSEMAGHNAWKQTDGAFDSHDPDSPVNPFELYITPDGITVIHKTMIIGPVLRWQEDTPAFGWQLTSDTCTIMGYPCQKAVTEFRGRVWHAWFCPSLPVDSGPYKFRGLPGLILKVQDSEKHFSWTMTGIEKGSWPIYEKQYLFQKCSPKEAAKILKDMYLRPFVFLKNTGIRTLLPDGKEGAREPGDNEYSVAMYYDPIELD